jgi:threonine synthase
MPSLLTAVVCRDCGHEMPPEPLRVRCDECDSDWLISRYDTNAAREVWQSGATTTRDASLWRYEELLPVNAPGFEVTMGEGWTPLIRAMRLQKELGLDNLWIKDERQSPTGCFKDRQAVLNVALLYQEGMDEVVLASTGNKATAFAAYCARAGIRPWIFLTSMVPNEKLRELGLYGSEVVKIAGTYDQAKKVASDFAARRNLRMEYGARSIMSQDGMKTIAFEIAEQLARHLPHEDGKWRVPDWYIQSVSGGIGPISIWQGFKELYAMGMIDRLPKLGVVQVEGCSPMVQAWEQNLEEAEPVVPRTRISVLATGDPGRTYTMLRNACIEGGGTMVAVDDGATFRAMRRMARVEGFSMEPATAVAFAGLEKMVSMGLIDADELVVVNCSGHTFPAEKHVLEDQYVLDLQLGSQSEQSAENMGTHIEEGLESALAHLDEQVTTVVIVDDNPQDSRLIRRLLQSYKNYRVFEANDPRDGLDLIRQRKPDLILTDLTMPDMDGFELLEVLKSSPDTRQIPVVVISAKTLSAAERHELESKANSLWQKGNFNTRELVDHVVRTLGVESYEDDDVDQDTPLTTTVGEVRDSFQQALETVGAATVLVVDDNRRDARLVRRILEATNRYHVAEAYSAQEALELIPTEQPQLIVLDVLLPDMQGPELLQTIKQRYDIQDIPIVVLTAKELNADEKNLFEAEGCSVWYKLSLDRQQLVDHVDELLKSQ